MIADYANRQTSLGKEVQVSYYINSYTLKENLFNLTINDSLIDLLT